ncbi:MAG: low-specificity L-threonine aldolase [Actinomycetota bacterium]
MIDLRSDTVSRPTDSMRQAMASAAVGDDVFGDDPTVQALEAQTAELLGKEAAVYVSSGTQSNLCGLLAHCGRGDEYIVGDHAHTYWYEAGGAAVLGSIQPQPVRMVADGSLDLDHVAQAVKPDDPHFARSKLLCLENTHDGKVQTVERMHESVAFGRARGLNAHLDGARLWNAAAALEVAPAAIAEPFDSVSVCLSKGLGAPIGSVLVGSHEFIREARKWRKMLGGAMRQVGVLAAAGQHALDHHRERVVDDHVNAARLGEGLGAIDGIEIASVATNMVFARLPIESDDAFMSAAEERNLLVRCYDGGETRLVTHLDVSADDVETTISTVAEILGS